jgi:hypothetical protein
MADETRLFEDLLTEPNLRSKVYELEEPEGTGLACIELAARRGPHWLFARTWIRVSAGRRLLFQTLDACERWGWRFAVASAPPPAPDAPVPAEAASLRASSFFGSLDDEEKALYQELFPAETDLLARGYDWDQSVVWRNGQALGRDPYGRLVEHAEGFIWEWVRVDEEFTWRRYPLERLRPAPGTSLASRQSGLENPSAPAAT